MYYEGPTQERECLWCEAPIEGRADKQFCSSSCKARYNRNNPIAIQKVSLSEPSQAASTTRALPKPSVILPPTPVNSRRADSNKENKIAGESTEAWKKFQREEEEYRNREKTVELHRMYSEYVAEFLQEEGSDFSLEPLEEFMDELDKAASEYRQHPGLRQPEHPAHKRIADLYLMRDYLRKMRDDLRSMEEEATSFFGTPEPAEMSLEISKKHRKQLRANLLGEE